MGLQGLALEFPFKLSNPRGRGLFCAFDLPNAGFRRLFLKRLFERRLLILPCGERSIRFRTALNIPQSDLEKGIRIIGEVLEEM